MTLSWGIVRDENSGWIIARGESQVFACCS
jgi:hypothetical protein